MPRTFGFHEKRDNAAVVKWLAKRLQTEVSSVGIWGPSFGAAVGLMTLEELPDLQFVIADSTFASFAEVSYDSIALLTHTSIAALLTPAVLQILRFRTGLQPEAVMPMHATAGSNTPVLLIHAKDDPAMAVRHSHAVYAANPAANVQLEITNWGAAHADSALVNPPAYRQLVNDFLARYPTTRHLLTAAE